MVSLDLQSHDAGSAHFLYIAGRRAEGSDWSDDDQRCQLWGSKVASDGPIFIDMYRYVSNKMDRFVPALFAIIYTVDICCFHFARSTLSCALASPFRTFASETGQTFASKTVLYLFIYIYRERDSKATWIKLKWRSWFFAISGYYAVTIASFTATSTRYSFHGKNARQNEPQELRAGNAARNRVPLTFASAHG